jgi:hypothetical protein
VIDHLLGAITERHQSLRLFSPKAQVSDSRASGTPSLHIPTRPLGPLTIHPEKRHVRGLAQALHAPAAMTADRTAGCLNKNPCHLRSKKGRMMKITELLTAASMAPLILGLAVVCSTGCENKDKVLDVETPNGNLEVERDRDTGQLDVDAQKEEDRVIDIDTPGADVEVSRDRDTGDVSVE